jgi:hypothetical protein
MLSMGEDLVDERKTAWSSRITVATDADLPSSMLGTMLKHGGGHATSQASKDGNNSSTLSLSLSFYMFVCMYMPSTTLDATFVCLSH